MLKLLKNIEIYSPQYLGKKDILIAGNTIAEIGNNILLNGLDVAIFNYEGYIITPGLIDQHIHIAGAGGKDGFASMTPEVKMKDLISCGTTTVVGLLGTCGTARNIRSLYSKAKSLEQEGISAFMLCGYYGVDSLTITDSIQGDMIFIDLVLGCKIAISDIRSSYPTERELLRKLRDVRVGGSIANKKGILHIHLGNLDTKMDILFRLIKDYQFPIENISPTHVARTKELFDQAIEFAKLGGMIDITTGATKYTDPYKAVLYALENGASIDNIIFSSDGNAGLSQLNDKGQVEGFKVAPFDKNLSEVVHLIKKGGIEIENAFKLVTSNPAKNLGLKNKGSIAIGSDADLCVFTKDLELKDVYANGKIMIHDQKHVINEIIK